jgi:hypothetical protein
MAPRKAAAAKVVEKMWLVAVFDLLPVFLDVLRLLIIDLGKAGLSVCVPKTLSELMT